WGAKPSAELGPGAAVAALAAKSTAENLLCDSGGRASAHLGALHQRPRVIRQYVRPLFGNNLSGSLAIPRRSHETVLAQQAARREATSEASAEEDAKETENRWFDSWSGALERRLKRGIR